MCFNLDRPDRQEERVEMFSADFLHTTLTFGLVGQSPVGIHTIEAR